MLGFAVVGALTTLAFATAFQEGPGLVRLGSVTQYAEYSGFSWKSTKSVQFFFQLDKSMLTDKKILLLYKDDGVKHYIHLFLREKEIILTLARVYGRPVSRLVQPKASFFDSKWHFVRLDWNSTHLSLTVDKISRATLTYSDRETDPSGKHLFIGGLPFSRDYAEGTLRSRYFDNKEFR